MISVDRISHSYKDKPVLHDVSFEVASGQCMAILGNNGAGKSTLVSAVAKIINPKTGNVQVDGRDFYHLSRNNRARLLAYVAQKNEASQVSVYDTILLGRKPYIKWALESEDFKKCDEVIHQMGLDSFKQRMVDELSGGELQKVMIARALVQDPKVLILDEPTSNLDPKNQHDVLSLVQSIARSHQIAVLIVLHDVTHALRYCDQFLMLKNGEVYSFGDKSSVSEKAIFDIYGVKSNIVEINGQKIVAVI